MLVTVCTIQYPETAASAINMAVENWLLYLKLLINSCKMGKTISAHIFAVPPPVTNVTESVLYVTDTSIYIDRGLIKRSKWYSRVVSYNVHQL